MDPLSICASAVALGQLASSITKSLYGFTKCALNAETHVAALRSELSTLTGCLSSIEKILQGGRHQSTCPALVDDDLQEQSEIALRNCYRMMNDLRTFVDRIKQEGSVGFWRFRVAIDLSVHSEKLATFRESISKSNAALQTVLHAITVSLALRSNHSQDLILLELSRLKTSIDEAKQVSRRSPGPSHLHQRSGTSDARVTRNLRNLAKAALNFHSAASSTATTIREGSSVAASTSRCGAAAKVSSRGPKLLAQNRVGGDGSAVDVGDEIATLSKHVIEVQEDFALAEMKTHNFDKAARYLEEAMAEKQRSPQSFNDEGLVRIQSRLAICYLFQRDRAKLSSLVNSLADETPSGPPGLEVGNLMHALALIYLAEYAFEAAQGFCTRAFQVKQNQVGREHPETLASLGLLAKIHEMSNNTVYQEAVRRMLPQDFKYHHPPDELIFITKHTKLLPQDFKPLSQGSVPVPDVAELDGGGVSAIEIQQRGHLVKSALHRRDMIEIDTSKEVYVAPRYPSSRSDASPRCSSPSQIRSNLKIFAAFPP
ncbi:hypothetical protein CDD83_7437 [Cordyceps sp. RAO-2017]|nr:hypothetical protein CDD83_7437 [Cordyceps sp. RAO-2017]